MKTAQKPTMISCRLSQGAATRTESSSRMGWRMSPMAIVYATSVPYWKMMMLNSTRCPVREPMTRAVRSSNERQPVASIASTSRTIE